MRSKIAVRYFNFIFSIIILQLIISTFLANVVISKDMEIIITDLSGNEITEIKEENYFKVSVIDPELEESPFLENVLITFNNIPYTIDESGEKLLQAPIVDKDTSFIITAIKESYNSTLKEFIIINFPQLYINPLDGTIVDAGLKFSVKVIDDKGNSVSNALVAIDNFGEQVLTDKDGIAVLKAPENKEKINIIAQKDGYLEGIKTLEVNIIPSWWDSLFRNPNFIIVLAVILLIIIILFVNYRQKKSIFTRAKEISNEKSIKKYSQDKILSNNSDEGISQSNYYDRDAIRSYSKDNPKVEEIRISRPRIEKKVIPVSEKENTDDKDIRREEEINQEDKWFEGDNGLKYEVDRLTKDADEEELDKWFEGVDELKDKIHEKMKEKSKKLKEEK